MNVAKIILLVILGMGMLGIVLPVMVMWSIEVWRDFVYMWGWWRKP